MTFKACSKVLATQSRAIREIERSIILKANKQEMMQQLSQKANVDDIAKTISEVAINIESRATYDDV